MQIVKWTDPQLDKIILLELMLILDVWHVTQCEGILKNGTRVLVSLPFLKLPRYGLRRMIIKYAKQDSIYAKGLKIFDVIKTIT